VSSFSLLGQERTCVVGDTIVKSLNEMLSDVSIKEQVDVSYDMTKSTLIFNVYDDLNELRKTYKLIVTDIHPEGIYSVEQEGNIYIKIISRCAGNVFIETTVRDSFLNSNSTDKILIGRYSLDRKRDIDSIIEKIKHIVRICTSKKKANNEGRIPLPVIRN